MGGEAVRQAGDSAVEVGRVFQAGGTDGLILYALVILGFLLFLIAVVLIVVMFRHMARTHKTNAEAFAEKDRINAEQTQLFIAAADRTAQAINGFTAAVARDTQERASQGLILAHLEGTDARMLALLERLDRVAFDARPA